KGYGQRYDPITEKELIAIGSSNDPREDIQQLSAIEGASREFGKYSVPLARASLKYWSPSKFDPEEAAALLAVTNGNTMPSNGVYAKQQYQSQHWPSDADR